MWNQDTQIHELLESQETRGDKRGGIAGNSTHPQPGRCSRAPTAPAQSSERLSKEGGWTSQRLSFHIWSPGSPRLHPELVMVASSLILRSGHCGEQHQGPSSGPFSFSKPETNVWYGEDQITEVISPCGPGATRGQVRGVKGKMAHHLGGAFGNDGVRLFSTIQPA